MRDRRPANHPPAQRRPGSRTQEAGSKERNNRGGFTVFFASRPCSHCAPRFSRFCPPLTRRTPPYALCKVDGSLPLPCLFALVDRLFASATTMPQGVCTHLSACITSYCAARRLCLLHSLTYAVPPPSLISEEAALFTMCDASISRMDRSMPQSLPLASHRAPRRAAPRRAACLSVADEMSKSLGRSTRRALVGRRI
jgi:hypothetical protein